MGDWNPTFVSGRVAGYGNGNTVRFRTRGHGKTAGDGGYSGHAGREVVYHNDGESRHQVSVHRLALFAWTPDADTEDLWAEPEDERTPDPRTGKVPVHHRIPIPWLNAEWNLEWREDHDELESRRKARGPDGAFEGPRLRPEEWPDGWATRTDAGGTEAE